MSWAVVFVRRGRRAKGVRRPLEKGWGTGGVMGTTAVLECIVENKCDRVASHVLSAALSGSVNWLFGA